MRNWYPITLIDQAWREYSDVAMNNNNFKEQIWSSHETNASLQKYSYLISNVPLCKHPNLLYCVYTDTQITLYNTIARQKLNTCHHTTGQNAEKVSARTQLAETRSWVQRINTEKFNPPKHRSLLAPRPSILKALHFVHRESIFQAFSKQRKLSCSASTGLSVQWRPSCFTKSITGSTFVLQRVQKDSPTKKNIVVFFKD